MKNVILVAAISLLSWLLISGIGNKSDNRQEIITVLKNETDYFAKKDFEKWSQQWSHSPDIVFTYTVNNQANVAKGWEQLSKLMKDVMAEYSSIKPNYERDFHDITVDGNLAVAHFTQRDSLDGTPTTKDESRTLKREGGKWKITGSQIINLTSFEHPPLQEPFHMTMEQMKPLMENNGTVIRMKDGWGGMSVLFNTIVPSGKPADNRVFEGLKDNSCQVPHWGYIVDGSLTVRYSDGKEETLKAGEVFYLRPGHLPIGDDKLTIIDFSPEKDIKALFAHIGRKMAELEKK